MSGVIALLLAAILITLLGAWPLVAIVGGLLVVGIVYLAPVMLAVHLWDRWRGRTR